MANYRKRPIVIEADVYQNGMEDGIVTVPMSAQRETARSWVGDAADDDTASIGLPYLSTLEGPMFIAKRDYVITGVKGERYPCKPDIFAMTYEPA